MAAMRNRVTLQDIAEAAHVSVSTVSKALKDQGNISSRTKILVRDAAQKLGYQANETPQTMRTWHSGMIGLISAELEGRPSLPVLIGAEDELGAAKHAVLLSNSRGNAKLEADHIEQLIAHGIDGLIIVGSSSDRRKPINPALAGNIPVVYAVGPSTNAQDCSVVCDYEQCGYLAVSHLAKQGRSRIAIIAGEPDAQSTPDRISGAKQALRETSASLAAPVRYGDWTIAWGVRAMQGLLDDGVTFDALYCCNDRIACGALRVLRDRGIRVPDDVIVIGQDNWYSNFLDTPIPLSSIDGNHQTIGRIAARCVLEAIRGNRRSGIVKVPGTLIPRASTMTTSAVD